MKVAKTWNGLLFMEQINRAAGRAIVGIGMQVAVETKRQTHVGETGNLRRSVHVAPVGGYHDGDEAASEGQDMMVTQMSAGAVEPSHGDIGPMVEVGSWLEYACVEWVGRGHPGVTQGLELVRGARADLIVVQAFSEEGLAGLRNR